MPHKKNDRAKRYITPNGKDINPKPRTRKRVNHRQAQQYVRR